MTFSHNSISDYLCIDTNIIWKFFFYFFLLLTSQTMTEKYTIFDVQIERKKKRDCIPPTKKRKKNMTNVSFCINFGIP